MTPIVPGPHGAPIGLPTVRAGGLLPLRSCEDNTGHTRPTPGRVRPTSVRLPHHGRPCRESHPQQLHTPRSRPMGWNPGGLVSSIAGPTVAHGTDGPACNPRGHAAVSHQYDSRTLRTILGWLTDYPYPDGFGWGVAELLAATKLPRDVIVAALTVLVWEGTVEEGTDTPPAYRLAEAVPQMGRPHLIVDNGGDAS